MLVMVSNSCKGVFHHLATKYPGHVGHLYSPDGWRTPRHWLPYALDNGAWPAYTKGIEWDKEAFLKHVQTAIRAHIKPLWIAVPDVVTERQATLDRWLEYEGRLRMCRIPLAFVVQDGMTKEDVPESADLIFVGGSTDWKWGTLRKWCQGFDRVHVGRVNTEKQLWICHDYGAESVDGTGWFHTKQTEQLQHYLQNKDEPRGDQLHMFET